MVSVTGNQPTLRKTGIEHLTATIAESPAPAQIGGPGITGHDSLRAGMPVTMIQPRTSVHTPMQTI